MALNTIHIMELTTKKIPTDSDKFRQAKVEISTPKNFPIKSKNLTLQL